MEQRLQKLEEQLESRSETGAQHTVPGGRENKPESVHRFKPDNTARSKVSEQCAPEYGSMRVLESASLYGHDVGHAD